MVFKKFSTLNIFVLIFVLLPLLISPQTTMAENNSQKIDLTEITLSKDQTVTNAANVDLVSFDNSTKFDNNVRQQDTTKTTSPKEKVKKCSCMLNPIFDLLNIHKKIDTSAEKINKVIDKDLDNLKDTPISGIRKIDKAVDSGIKHIDGAVETTLEGLNEVTIESSKAAKDLLTTGIQKETVQQWIDGDFATGRFFGSRPLLESHGVTINSSYLYSPFMKTGGGANGENSFKGYGLFNLGVTLDTEKAELWKGGTFFALYQKKMGYGLSGGANPDGAMGDFMGFDGWDWRQINQISEYWYQHKFFDGKIRVKFGKQDANTDFAYLNSGWDFMNSAFSVIPTVPLVTYPDQSFGFMAEINPKEWLSIRDGIYSRFNVPYNITEIEVKPKIKNLPGRYMVGAWELSDSSGMGVTVGEDSSGSVYNNFYRNYGAYINCEQMIYKEKKDDNNDLQGLVVFLQAGISPSNKNDMSKYVGGGLHYVGPIPKRDKDIAGIAVGCGNFAHRLNDITYDNGGRVGSETVAEAFYRVQINRWCYLQPDIQFISHPGGIYSNSVAVGLRTVITF